MNVIEDLLPYYGQPELAPLVAELIEATNEIDRAFERQECAVKALTERFQALEDERTAKYAAVEQAA